MDVKSADITDLLPAWGKGGEAEEALFRVLEPELRQLAQSSLRRVRGVERKIQPDELVNDAYLKLKQYLSSREDVSFENRRAFYGLVLKVMRHVLLDLAKKGGKSKLRTTLVFPIAAAEAVPDRKSIDAFTFYLALDRLHAKNEHQAVALELHYIAGWTLEQSAELMGLSTATLKRQLAVARQWLEFQLGLSDGRLE
jgi:RNA polymerase sigma factor (TIGR02999 family)